MSIAIWILRVGLSLELLGGVILSLDLLTPEIRKDVRVFVERLINARYSFAQFLSIIFPITLYIIFI